MFSIKTPSEYLSMIRQSLTKEQKLAFCSAFLIGFFCHLFIFTNSMYNNDDIRYLYVTFDKPELGRWLQTYAGGVSSYFSLPVVNGLLALLYGSLTSMVLTTMFHLKNKINIFLVSGLLITFPTVASLYSYMFAADPFLLSMLFSSLAAYFAVKTESRYGWIAGAAFLCASVGIYQAYLPFTLLLMLLFFFRMLLQPNAYSDKLLLASAARYILTLALGMAAYSIGMELTLKAKHITLSDYQGIGESSLPGISEIGIRLRHALEDFLEFFRPPQVLSFNPWMKAALIAVLLLLAVFFFTLYIRNRVYQSLLRNLLLLLGALCIPLSVNVLYLISNDVSYHMLMRHAWCLLFIAVPVLSEAACGQVPLRPGKLLEWGVFISLLLVVWNYILLSNIAYFNMNFRYEKTYALCLEIRDKMKESDDYDRKRPVAFIGNYSKVYKMEAVSELLSPMTGMKSALIGSSSRLFLPLFQNCLGEDISVVTPQQEEELKRTPEFEEMPRFPHDGSIRVIDGVTVVKLNDD